METKTMLQCLLCHKEVASVGSDGMLQCEGPDGATFFHADGNYGSQFDPINNSPYFRESLVVVFCDSCLHLKAKENKIVERTVRTEQKVNTSWTYYGLES